MRRSRENCKTFLWGWPGPELEIENRVPSKEFMITKPDENQTGWQADGLC